MTFVQAMLPMLRLVTYYLSLVRVLLVEHAQLQGQCSLTAQHGGFFYLFIVLNYSLTRLLWLLTRLLTTQIPHQNAMSVEGGACGVILTTPIHNNR